jgi:hypothetical protein
LIEILFGFVETGKRFANFSKLRIIRIFMIGLIVQLRRFGEVFVGSSDFKFCLEVDFMRGEFGFVKGLGAA